MSFDSLARCSGKASDKPKMNEQKKEGRVPMVVVSSDIPNCAARRQCYNAVISRAQAETPEDILEFHAHDDC